MTNSKYQEAISFMEKADSVAVFMHINPDPDCIGSALALALFLKKKGKKVSVFTPDTRTTTMVPEKVKFLPHIDMLNKCDRKEFDLSIAVDLGETGRIGDLALPTFYKGEKSLVIDHHETYTDFADATVREECAGSAAQIIYKIMCDYDKTCIDKDIASLLYAGLVTDSGNFSYESTSTETFSVASELLGYGIDFSDITRRLTKDVDYNVYRLKTKVLSEAHFFADNRLVVIIFRQKDFMETGTKEKDTDGVINEAQNVTSVQLAISIAEVGTDRFKVSFRSKGEISARACAEAFGGGGHLNASGCRISGKFEDVFDKLVSVGKSKLK